MGWGQSRRWRAGALALGVVAAVYAGWRAWGRDPEVPPTRLTSVGGVQAFLWSWTGPRLLLTRGFPPGPANRWVADYSTASAREYNLSTPAARAALVGEFGAVDPHRVAPNVTLDGACAAAGEPDSVRVVDVKRGRSTVVVAGGVRPSPFLVARWIFGPTWAPDGRRIAFTALETEHRGGLVGWGLDRVLSWVGVRGSRLLPSALNHRGHGLLRQARRLYVVDAASARVRRVLDLGQADPPLRGPAAWLQWSPDGRRLGFIRNGDVWSVPVPP